MMTTTRLYPLFDRLYRSDCTSMRAEKLDWTSVGVLLGISLPVLLADVVLDANGYRQAQAVVWCLGLVVIAATFFVTLSLRRYVRDLRDGWLQSAPAPRGPARQQEHGPLARDAPRRR